MITPILILHGKLTTAIALKQALERSPRCEVHPFTTPDAAIEYAREHTQDAALIDLVTLGGSAAAAAIDALRSVQPAILIVVMPPPGDEQMRALAADAALPSDFRPADLLRLIDNWLKRRTTPMSAVEPGQPGKSGLLEHIFDDDLPPPPDTLPEQPATLEGVLQQMGHDGFGYPPAPEDSSRDNYYDAIEDVTYDEGATPNDPQSSAPNAGAPRQPRTDFDALVESLRREPPPVGSRMADFIIRGGADIVLGYDDPIAPTRPEIDRRARPAQYSDTAMRLHRRLAQDEPPMPGAAEGGTISDLISGVHDKGFERVLSILRGDSVLDESSEIIVGRPIHPDAAFEFAPAIMTIDPPPRPRESFDFDAVPQAESPARVMLEQTLEQSMSLGEFSIEDLLDSIEQRLPETRIKPLPPHVRQNAEQRWRAARQAAEMAEAAAVPSDPADLPEGMSSDQTTRASQAQHFESRPDLLETEWIDAPVVGIDATRAVTTVQDASARALPDDAATPPDTLPELSDLAVVAPRPFETPHDASANLERGEGADWGEWYTEDFNTQFELMAAFDLPAPRVSVVPSVPSAPAAPFSPPAAAVLPPTPAANVAPPTSEQVALTLTHAALETTAEAALLLRKGEIVAQAGRMLPDELLTLQPSILAAHQTGRRDARVQFVTQQDTGRDYLLYTCTTEVGTLTLIFKGATSMSDIRRQGTRLVEALSAVPEQAAMLVPPSVLVPPVEIALREPFAYVWLLRDPEALLDDPASKAIGAGMAMQLRENAWRLHDLQVRGDYVYLYADVPGDEPAFRVVRDLKARSAAIVRALNPAVHAESLWADSYLIVTPGRALDGEEIQQFINFERM